MRDSKRIMINDKALWQVSLSDGSTYQEEKGDFTTTAGQPSPFQRLLFHIQENKLNITITSLSLYTESGRTFSLPSSGRNPKFRAFSEAPKPSEYRFYRKMGCDNLGKHMGKEDRYTVIEAKYPTGYSLQLWVEDKTHNSWVLMV